MDLVMANQGENIGGVVREYRKGNWTVQETMILIEAKKMDEERRMKRLQVDQSSSSEGRVVGAGMMVMNKPAELRWKWVEDYCWRKGCLRSQNQCNDKWDNLMRDFKKVRDYERRFQENVDQFGGTTTGGHHQFSYWKIDKTERKDKNLPSNMLPQIYEALVQVVEKKGQRVFGVGVGGVGTGGGCGGGGGGETSTSNPNIVTPVLGQGEKPTISIAQTVPSVPQLQHHISSVILQPPQLPQHPPPQPLPYSQPLSISDSDTSEHSNSSAKRRRRGGGNSAAAAAAGGGGGGTAHEVGSAISRSASLIAGAIQASEEKEERRHRELLSMHEKRLQIEESKAEINKQGINGLVDAINKLAHSVLALAANKNPTTPK